MTIEVPAKFAYVLSQTGAKKVLILCTANCRVTTIYSLVAMQHICRPETQADAFRAVR
jgi:hypothetical protein